MKLWRVDFPFFILIGTIFLYSILPTFGQVKPNPSQQDLDSISHYYKLSKARDSLSLSERLQYVTFFLEGAEMFQNDSLVYNGLMQKTMLLSKVKMYDSAIVYSNKLYTLAKQNKDTAYIRKAFSKLGRYHKRNNELAEAFKFYNEAFKVSRIIEDSLNSGRSLLHMAYIQAMLGDYSGSKTTATDGLRYVENTSDLRSLSGLYHCISVAYSEQKDIEEALRYNSLALSVQGNNDIEKNTKALILADKGNYEQGIAILSELASNSILKEDKREYARIIGNLGYIKWLQNKENENSEKLLLRAKEIREEIDDPEGLIASNIYLAKYYFDENREKALHNAEAAYQNALKLKSLTSIIESLGFVFQLKENIDEEAKVFNETYLKLSEINQSNREIYAVTKYENENLVNQNLILKAETARKERQEIIYLFGTIILFLAAGLVFYLLQQRHKREKIREVFNAEARISKKLHDELANDVYNVMTQVQNNRNDQEVLDKLENIYSRTRDISRENSDFDIGHDYAQELSGMLSSYGSDRTKIIIKDIDDINWQSITPEKKIIVHRIIQELMVNMKKHSHAELVAITFKKVQRRIEIGYADTGVGVSKNDIIYSSGLRNAENRIKTIGGSFIFDSERGKGFKAKIFFPN